MQPMSLPPLIAALALTFAAVSARADPAAWRRAIAGRDAAFAWREGASYVEGGAKVQELLVTSQRFQGEDWRHLVAVAWREPLTVSEHALVVVSGGDATETAGASTGPRLPADERQRLAALAVKSGVLTAVVRQVPNQPILGGKREDEAIAHTLAEYFKSDDPQWPLLRPMARAVARSFDAVQELAQRKLGAAPARYVVTGASKRGWTSWLLAVADSRVEGTVPVVFDMLDMRAQLVHQKASWGAYSEQLGDYSERGLPAMLGTPAGAKLLAWLDPIRDAARTAARKLAVFGTNDRYWPFDAANLYWSRVRGPAWTLYLANEGHDFKDQSKLEDDRVAMAMAAAGRLTLPRLDARSEAKPQMLAWTIKATARPAGATVWRATAPSRDFREARWTPSQVAAPGTTLAAGVPSAPSGWTASFVELRFELDGRPFHVSTRPALIGPDGKMPPD